MKSFLEMVATQDFLVLDTETTGLQQGEICQIAIINAHGDVLLDTFVKTANPIPLDATRIHGIVDAMVASAPTFNTLSSVVQEIVRGQQLVVYNAVYDRKMMHQSAEACAIEKTEWKNIARWWCAMESYAEFWGDWNSYRQSFRWQKLTDACRQQDIPVSNAHSALGDCRMTLQLIHTMSAKFHSIAD